MIPANTFPHHQETIQRAAEALPANAERLSLLLIGSVARGNARADSDIDLYLLVRDTQQLSRDTQQRLAQLGDLAIAPCGGISVDPIDQAYLDAVEARGNEPARWAFTAAKIICGATPALQEQLERIARYPQEQQLERMLSFRSQLDMHFSYLELAEWSGNRYLLHETAYKIVHFAGRLLLAAQKQLYPNRKWFWQTLVALEQKPAAFCADALAFLEAPSIRGGAQLLEKLYAFRAFPLPAEGTGQRFARDSVHNWRYGTIPPEEV